MLIVEGIGLLNTQPYVNKAVFSRPIPSTINTFKYERFFFQSFLVPLIASITTYNVSNVNSFNFAQDIRNTSFYHLVCVASVYVCLVFVN